MDPAQDKTTVGTPAGLNLRGQLSTPNIVLPSRVDRNETFLRTCKFRCFSPRFARPSNTELLLGFARAFGRGLNQFQFCQMLRQCNGCQNFVFTDRLTIHQCDGPVLQTQADNFDIVRALVTMERNAGLSRLDFCHLFTCCDLCHRVFLEHLIFSHACMDI
ncbi:hypothetical protein FA13DRAFT_1731081 [Coprinellus micaceus]|uniref:Uncharacterized protein n=1 Tax=Coprinellus micaceus TaxID=71717 RepID=A0A4Y7TIK8_COPMI|nr:hypothetical protein FA13DRAFT_1731081 [Coprinellus micaceus]